MVLALWLNAAYADENYARRYAASTDLREFIVRRSESPQAGSFFYAYWARWECSDDGGIARRIMREARPLGDSAQGKATRLQLERCRNLSGADTSIALQRDDVTAGRAAGDKLFGAFPRAGESWFAITEPSDLRRALAFLTAAEDPNIVWVISQGLAGLAAANRLVVNGNRSTEAEGRSFYVAFLLAACDLNVDCGPSHRWMRTWCIQNAECEDRTIEAYWRRRDADNADKMNWQTIERYRNVIVSAQRTADWSAFAIAPER